MAQTYSIEFKEEACKRVQSGIPAEPIPTRAQQGPKRVTCQPERIKKREKSRKTKNWIESFRFGCLC